MRYLLLWELFWFDPSTAVAIWRQGSEVHISAYSCHLARRELQALTTVRAICRPDGSHPEQFGTTTTRRYFLGEDTQRQIMFGNRVNGRYVSRHIKGG